MHLSDILLENALKYNSLGMAAHPIGFGGKGPLPDEWSQPPALTAADLTLVFEKRSDIITGIGFCSGFMSNGLCVLDFDSEWENSLDNFQHSWPELAPTALYSTAHGRRQMILRLLNLPDSQTVTKFQRGAAIIELRANGANNVLPPSYHARCNKPYCTGDSFYEWLVDPDNLEFTEVEYSDLLTWLKEWGQVVEDSSRPAIPENPVEICTLDRMIAGKEARRALETAKGMIRKAQDGCKRSTTLRAAGLVGGYVAVGVLDRQEVFDILEAEISKKPNVDSMDVARDAINAGLEWGSKRPFTASKILDDKIEWAKQQNGNGTVIQLPTVTVEDDSSNDTSDNMPPVTFRPWEWAEFLSRPPKQWHIENFIGPGDIVVLAGDSGSGKTVLMLDMAMKAIVGEQYAGQFNISAPLKIAYCTAEGIGNLPARIKAARELYNVPMAIIESRFFGYEGPIIPQFFLSQDNEYSIERFERDLQTLGISPDILIVDTLALAAIAGNLEDNFDVTASLIRARQFTNRTGIATLFTHHNNRAGEFRGAASLRDNSDGLFVARYDKEKDERKLLCRDDKWGKLKDGEEWPGLVYTLEAHPAHPAPVVKWLGEYVPENRQGDKNVSRDILALFPKTETILQYDNVQAALGDSYAVGSIKNGLTRLVNEEKLIRFYQEPNKPPSKSNPPYYKKSVKALLG